MLLATVALAAGAVAVPRAIAGRPTIDTVVVPATPERPATRLGTLDDAVSVSGYGGMAPTLVGTLESIGVSLGIPSVRGRSFNIGLYAVRRGDQVVQQAAGSSGVWQFPMSVTSLPVDAIGRVMSQRVSAAVASGSTMVRVGSAIFGARQYPA